ncbi:MAG: sugar ABC transporter permease [Candidatus Atribacteria bacterium]|nr:sugar ABC transporter permease [Candidatus Atribacteria bacterium]
MVTKKNVSLAKSNIRFCWFSLTPALIVIMAVVALPLIYAIAISFTNLNFMRIDYQWVGLQNYQRLFFQDIYFWSSVLTTVKWVIGTTFIPYIIGLATALLLNQKFHGNTFFKVVVVLPWVVPNVIAAFMWERLYDTSYGAVNWVLSVITGREVTLPWLSSSNLALYALMGIMIWRNMPFMSVMLLAALKTIPIELYEAATIDGAGVFQQFRYITLPQIKNVSGVSLLLMSIWMFNHFDVPYVLLRGGPGTTSRLLPIHTYMIALNQLRLGYGSASGVILMLIILILAGFYLRTVLRQEG